METDTNIHETMGERWEFNGEVTRVFDEMLGRSIPQYQTMRAAVYEVGRRFVQPQSSVVDLGCSRGEALAPLVDEFEGRCGFVACEVSEPMRDAARDRFTGRAGVYVKDTDLRFGYPVEHGNASLTLCVLTLQFVPINYRQRILADACRSTQSGGALILVEKILGDGHRVDQLMVDLYHETKQQAGYTREEVERKRLALEGVLVPVTASWNEQMLMRAGFTEVDCFWRFLNFAAWVAVK